MNKVTKDAVKAAGGPRPLARVLNITPQAVIQWPRVPAKHVLEVERLSGVTRYELRPDIYGPDPKARPTKRAESRPAA